MSKVYNTKELSTLHVVDVGASGGIHPRWNQFYHKAVLVEPDPREVERLRETLPENYILIDIALSDTKGDKKFYLYRKQQCSSFFLPNTQFVKKFPNAERFDLIDTITMKTDTLDNQLMNIKVNDIDFIKLDVEGYEVTILKGAEKSLEQVIGLEVEISYAQLRLEQPLFHEVHDYISKRGFDLIDIRKVCWNRSIAADNNFGRKGQAIVGDALYLRNPDNVLKLFAKSPHKIINSTLIYLSYGYYDLAAELVHLAKEMSVLSAKQLTGLSTILDQFTSKESIPKFIGRSKIRGAANLISKELAPSSWSYGDAPLGNE